MLEIILLMVLQLVFMHTTFILSVTWVVSKGICIIILTANFLNKRVKGRRICDFDGSIFDLIALDCI